MRRFSTRPAKSSSTACRNACGSAKCTTRSRRGLMGEEDVYAELGDVVTGKRPGREGDELIVCDLTGVGVQDAAIAELAWNALER